MFASKALPLPSRSTFTSDAHAFTSSAPASTAGSGSSGSSGSDMSRPLPHGPCKFILLHPTQQNQQCSCQSYHLNRMAPGSICDCGHQACYHVHAIPAPDHARQPSTNSSQSDQQALLGRIKRLEEALQREQQSREADMVRQKGLWEADIRMLREALAPFYKTELEMRRKLADLEDRVDANHDELLRLKDRVVALDDASMLVEKRIQDMEARPKRRRTKQPNGEEEHLCNGSSLSNGTHTISHHLDDQSVRSSSSQALSPHGSFGQIHEPEEPRSSGILNLVDPSRPRPYAPPASRPKLPFNQRPVLYEREEPRSSGFLALDLAEREDTSSNTKLHMASQRQPERGVSERPSPPHYSQSNPDQSLERRSPSFPPPPPPPPPPAAPVAVPVPVPAHQHQQQQQRPSPPSYASVAYYKDYNPPPVFTGPSSLKKRKYMADRLALDVLADVSMASPMIH